MRSLAITALFVILVSASAELSPDAVVPETHATVMPLGDAIEHFLQDTPEDEDTPEADINPDAEGNVPHEMAFGSGSGKGVGSAYRPDDIDGTIDDDSDYHSDDVNSEGFNKLVGPGSTSHLDGGSVKSPGYSWQDTITSPDGHYYIGPSRRRIGAGFGRRRRTLPTPPATPAPTHVHMFGPTEAPTPAPTLPEVLKPLKEQIEDGEKDKAEAEMKGIKEVVSKETGDLDKDEVEEASKTAIKTALKHKIETTPKPEAETEPAAPVIPLKPVAPVAPAETEPSTLKITVKTGTEANAQTGQKPSVTVVGTTGEYQGTIHTAGKGKSKTTTFHPPKDIGVITSVTLKASSSDGWLLDALSVVSGDRAPVEFGCLHRWLDGKKYDSAASYKGLLFADHFTLKPGVSVCPKYVAPSLKIRVTTGTHKYAESGQAPTVTVVGANGKHTGKIHLAGKGKAKTTTFALTKDLGAITSVAVQASSSDGWKLAKFEVKSSALPWEVMGCTPLWLDGKPYDHDPYDAEYGDKFTLHAGACVAKFPASWGAKTKSGCFCKMSGTSGKCGLNGAKYKWCRTRDSCKGTASSNGNWDKC